MKMAPMMEASTMKMPVAPVESTPAPPRGPTPPVPSARVDRTGESKGQHSHDRESDDLQHGQLLLDGLRRESPRLAAHSNAQGNAAGPWPGSHTPDAIRTLSASPATSFRSSWTRNR